MKKIFLLFISLLVIVACTKKQVPFEAFSAQAFAFDLGDGTAEVNASVRVKGFKQTEKDNIYNASVAYEVDLIKPDSSVVNSVFKYVQKSEKQEPINDISLEAQFILDSSYQAGSYTLVFRIADEKSENKTEAKTFLELEW